MSVENVLDDLVRQYLDQTRRDKLQQETENFVRMYPELRESYYRQHVAIHHGRLVDHDDDLDELIKRVRRKFGRNPVLIGFIEDEAVPTYHVRRPRLQSFNEHAL